MKQIKLASKRITAVRIIILSVAVSMLVFGIFRDEPAAVLQKAVRICLECIGIG
ncbi:MAG: CD1871A family CXXC motif-containing protein [Oscillospiraceae bacterium]|nr:CD1871A family CXXC motif-containing protein [Oscillospiraceae bacterium]